MIFHSLEFEIPLVSFLFILILCINYFSKKRIKLVENKTYEIILISSLLASFFDTIVHIISALNTLEIIKTKYFVFINCMNKIMATLFIVIFSCLLCYILLISYYKLRKNSAKLFKIFTIFNIFVFMILNFTNIEIYEFGTVRNVSGTTTIFGYGLVALLIICTIIITIKNFKKDDKRYYTIFLILIMIGLLYALSILFRGFIIYDLIIALLCYIMYFTIENPDIKIIRELELAKNEAEKASRAKSDFLSSMSHEIRTPLNAIVGLSEDISTYEDKVPKEVIEDTIDIKNASNTLLEIVGNILDINKIESNQMEIIETIYNFKEEINNLVKVISTRIGDKNIKLNTSISKDIPEELLGDKVHIKEIITNLLTNAIKYTDKGEINLDIKCINKSNICNLTIIVKDTGRGIKKENIDNLFTKFNRLDSDINTTIEGTGLGLAITKSLVDLMNGKIKVTSIYGECSTFTVTIPQKINIKDNNIKEDNSIDNDISYGHKKILIVDDNKLNIKVMIKTLLNFDFDIDTAEDGLECLDKVKDNKYDLILMDIMMPNLNGEETLIKLKENKSFNTPVIAVTADAIKGTEERLLNIGFIDYISKPFTKKEIKEKLNKVFIKEEKIDWEKEPTVEFNKDKIIKYNID